MAITKTTIANMALSHLGTRSNIESLTEQSVEARQMNLWYDISRKQLLSMYNWNFARKRAELAEAAEDAPDGVWTFRYLYPSDAIRIREIENASGSDTVTVQGNVFKTLPQGDAVPFEVEMDSTGQIKTILTDLENARVIYTFDATNAALFPMEFIDILSHLLAANTAMGLTGKRQLKVDEFEIVRLMLATLTAHDANERQERPQREAEWVRTR